jgi:cyclin D1/2/4
MEETFVPLPLDLQVAEAKFVFEGRTIKRMELLVLSTLKWRMQAVTACSFIDYFLHKLNDHGAPSMLARSRSADLILSTAKGVEFLVFKSSELAASVALAAMGELRSSILERAATGCKYLNKERVSRCYGMIQEKIILGNIVLKSAGSSMSSVPQSPIGVLDAATCLSQQSDDTTVGSSPATCYHSSSSKRRRISRRLL